MRITSVTRLAALSALACVAVSLRAGAQETYSLKRVFNAGEVDRYRSVISVQAQANDGSAVQAEMTIDTTERTRQVDPDGNAIVVTRVDAAVLRLGEDVVTLPGVGLSVTTAYDKTGRMIKQDLETRTVITRDQDGKEVRHNGGSGVASRVANLLPFTRPVFNLDRSLKAGDEWKYDIAVGGKADQRVQGVFRLVGLAARSATVPLETLKITDVGDGFAPSDAGSQKVHVEASFYIEPGTGKCVMTEGFISTAQTGTTKPAKVAFKRIRLLPGAGGPGQTSASVTGGTR